MVGIIILNFNSFDYTVQCIESVKNNTKIEHKIYLVDNGSRREIKERLIEKYNDDETVEIVLNPENLGYSGGNNAGVKAALAEGVSEILITNNDVIFENDVAKILKNALYKDCNIAVAGPAVKTLDKSNGQFLISTYSFKAAILDRMPFHKLVKLFPNIDPNPKAGNDEITFDGMVSGCCFMIKALIFEEIGLFDDNVFLYSEERIISCKLNEHDYKSIYVPDAKIIHLEGKTTGGSNPFADYHRYISDYYTIFRYCSGPDLMKRFIKFIRLFNFRIKALKDESYRPYFVMLKQKMKKIESGDYKIHFKE